MSYLLADIDATCSSFGNFDGNLYYISDDSISSLKHLIWILKRDNLDSHEYRRYIGHKKVIQTDLLPILVHYHDNVELSDVLLRLLVNLTSPPMLFFREDLPKDGAGRRTYLDLMEIAHSYKDAFSNNVEVWKSLAKRLQKILEIEVGLRSEEQNLVFERVLVLMRNVLQVPTNQMDEKRVDNDVNIHDKVLWTLHESGMFDFILYILSSEYENQFQLHALEVTFLIFREQKVETLAIASVQRSEAEKQADEAALIAAREMEKMKVQQRIPPARHSRFGGTYVYQNMKSVSERDLICHLPLERVVQRDLNHDKQKAKANFRLAKDDEKYHRQSAFFIRLCLREFCIEILNSAFNNLVRQVRRVLERNGGFGETQSGGHDQSYLLWAMRFFLEFNRLNGFSLHLVTEALSTGSIHWIQNQIQHDSEMIQTDKKMKLKWNRRLQLGIQAYREFLKSIQAMELINDEDTQSLLKKLRMNIFYVVEYREIILHLLLSYNENSFTRNYLRDLIDTTNVFMKMMEKFCQGSQSVMVQTKTKKKSNKKKPKPKKASKENILEKLSNDWDMRISSNLSVVLTNEINISVQENPVELELDDEMSVDEQRSNCRKRIHKLLLDEDYERAVLLMRAARVHWTEATEIFGTAETSPEDELMLMKDIFLADIEAKDDENDGNEFWDELENSASDNDDEEERETAMKEVVLHFSDFEKRLLNPKVVRACTWCLQGWEKMNYVQIKSAVTILHRIAVNLKSPVMLMQAQLFRVFQQVFNVPKDSRHEELRRLGTFVIRQFVKIAPQNPKIFAELLFFNSMRETHEIEHGYSEGFGGVEAKQQAWSEEQEAELQRLFMQNQESPQTDQDVIDWICENLSGVSRSRRGVIKKLKELGMIFKAPTKRSNAAALNKNLFMREEDEKLRELFEEYRLEADCLKRIMEAFEKKRNKKTIVKRMIQLGLIADEKEILPSKRKMKEKHREHEEESDDRNSESSEDDVSFTEKIVSRKLEARHQLRRKEALSLLNEVEESHREGILWIIESLNEAVEDFEEVSDELDDAIPIVPLSAPHRESLENSQFIKLLSCLNLIEPKGQENYWKIPANMIPDELKMRVKLLSGEGDVEEQEEENKTKKNNKIISDEEDDDVDDLFSRLRAQRDVLIYNTSDNEEKLQRIPSKKIGKVNTKLIKTLKKIVDKDALKWLSLTLSDKMSNKTSGDVDELLLVPSEESHQDAVKDENFIKLLTALNLEMPEGIENYWKVPHSMTLQQLKNRVELLTPSDDEDESSDEEMVIRRKKRVEVDSESLEINTQALKQRLAELSSSSDDESNENRSKLQTNKRKIMDSSDEDILNASLEQQRRKSSKKERSATPDENEMNASNSRITKRNRRIADSSDDE